MGTEATTLIQTPTTAATPGTSIANLPKPETVLHRAEIEQSRRMAITGTLFDAIAVASWPFVAGEHTAKLVATVSLAASAVNNALLWRAASDPRRYTERKVVGYFVAASVLNVGIVYLLGVFGPILVMFVLNVYTACLGYGRRVALAALVGSIAPYVMLAAPITAGLIHDPGLMSATSYIGVTGRAIVVVSFTIFLCLVYSQARRTREEIVTSLVERDEAVRNASHREALFLEARRDLENALRAGGLGRFSDQTLGSYKLGAVLARGGMGEVYEATHVNDGSKAAVKLLLPEVLTRPEFVRRFLREVRIAGQLDSPHVVRVLEVGGESAAFPYLAMERLEGADLAQVLRDKERLEHAEVIGLVRQVAIGLAVAHAAGIVHRDLKPQNLFRAAGPPPTWKILDFGVSKLAEPGARDGALTEGIVLGTPQYMAPEQARSGEVTAAADLYALATVAYRALTGVPPFQGDGSAVLVSVLTAMPVRPSALAAVPSDVDLALAIGMAKSAKDRFDSGDALADALDAALASRLDDKLRRRATKLLRGSPWREPGGKTEAMRRSDAQRDNPFHPRG